MIDLIDELEISEEAEEIETAEDESAVAAMIRQMLANQN